MLLGPSGCGKTTTLRMISGLEAVTEGKILFEGKDVTWLHRQRPRHCLRVPVLRTLPAHERTGEHRLPAGIARAAASGNQKACDEVVAHVEDRACTMHARAA